MDRGFGLSRFVGVAAHTASDLRLRGEFAAFCNVCINACLDAVYGRPDKKSQYDLYATFVFSLILPVPLCNGPVLGVGELLAAPLKGDAELVQPKGSLSAYPEEKSVTGTTYWLPLQALLLYGKEGSRHLTDHLTRVLLNDSGLRACVRAPGHD